MVVIVNTDKSETFEETGARKLEDDNESDEKEGEDGRGVDVAGEGGVHGQDPDQTGHDTHLDRRGESSESHVTAGHLGGQAGLEELVVEVVHPAHHSHHRPDDGRPVPPEHSDYSGEDETAGVLLLHLVHPGHDLPHPVDLLDGPEQTVHLLLPHQLVHDILTDSEVETLRPTRSTSEVTPGLKFSEAHTVTIINIVQSFSRAEPGGNPRTSLDMREPAVQEITMERQEASGDWTENCLPSSCLRERAVMV